MKKTKKKKKKKTLQVFYIILIINAPKVSVCAHTRACTHTLSLVQLFAILWTVAHQSPLFMEFSRQEYCSGLLFPTPGDLPDWGIEPTSLVSPVLAGGFFITPWEALK